MKGMSLGHAGIEPAPLWAICSSKHFAKTKSPWWCYGSGRRTAVVTPKQTFDVPMAT